MQPVLQQDALHGALPDFSLLDALISKICTPATATAIDREELSHADQFLQALARG